MLQCVAMCCSVLQRVLACCSGAASQGTCMCCSVSLQYMHMLQANPVVCCSVLQACWCSVEQAPNTKGHLNVANSHNRAFIENEKRACCCSVLQTKFCCVLQRVATVLLEYVAGIQFNGSSQCHELTQQSTQRKWKKVCCCSVLQAKSCCCSVL